MRMAKYCQQLSSNRLRDKITNRAGGEPKIGDYLAKHVIGNDNVEPFLVFD